MAKFNFKLEGLLKLREFKEDQLRNELGEIVRKLNQTRDDIERLNKEIDEAYFSQEKVLASPESAQMARFFDYFIRGKKEHIKDKESALYSIQKKYEKKAAELAQAMGEVKVMDNLKQKHFDEFKHENDKIEQNKIEEFVIMRAAEKGK